MPGKFQNKYRIESARLKNWDYGSNAIYFVTICTQHRKHYFGKITNAKMILNAIGELVAKEWLLTPEIRPDMNLEMGEFMVMPNHFHALITIGKNNFNRRYAMLGVSTKSKFGPQSKNLASIIRGFKSAVTVNARKINPQFTWHVRFHDHIVRDFDSFQRIEQYIINNPSKWDEDLYSKK